ncbi:MAG TPA: DMT family transporter [Sumerlaeia bacterium]|nr:DMT family transporter [Sumerlaeia bacterium]
MTHTAQDASLKPRALLCLLTTILLWAVNPLFMKYFTGYYDVWTQNAFRYSCAAAGLLGFSALTNRRGLRLNRSQWGKLCLVAAPNVFMQISFAGMYYFIYPSVASLVGRINIFIVGFLSFLLFRDERRVIRSRGFLVGSALSLAGVVVVILAQDPATLERLEVSQRTFWIGIAVVVANAFFGGLYTLAIKRLVRDVDPVVSFTHVSWMTALALIGLMAAVGRPSDLWRQPATPLLFMVLTAVGSILIAHTAYYAALRHIKAVVTVSLMQLIPVGTCAISAFWYGDRLSPLQIAGGGAVLGGAWLAAVTQARLDRRERAALRERGL